MGVEEGRGRGLPFVPGSERDFVSVSKGNWVPFSSGGSIGRFRTLLFGETTLHLWSNIIQNVRWRPMDKVPHQTRMASPRTAVFGGIGSGQEARGKMQAFQGAWEGHEGGSRASQPSRRRPDTGEANMSLQTSKTTSEADVNTSTYKRSRESKPDTPSVERRPSLCLAVCGDCCKVQQNQHCVSA